MKLTKEQREQFLKVLVEAFSSAEFDRMLDLGLNKNREEIAFGDDKTDRVFEVIKNAERRNWVDKLLRAAREYNPENPDLLTFSEQFGLASTSRASSQQFGLTPTTEPWRNFEKVVKQQLGFRDIAKWREQLGQIEGQVCRIEIATGGKSIYGTGFLLGPDVVITNYHVMEAVIDGINGTKIASDKVVLRFDYKRMPDGVVLNEGVKYQLADADWLIDHSPPSPYDRIPEPKDKVPSEEQLDYALLRVKGTPGRDPVGGQNRAPVRNWIRVPAAAYDFPAESIVFIVQHPDGGPLQLAFDPITGLNSNKTRVWYKTNTEGGSSGSPCFNYNWDLIALHHSGDPNWFRPPQYNEGIPFSAILALLKKRGVDGVLGG